MVANKNNKPREGTSVPGEGKANNIVRYNIQGGVAYEHVGHEQGNRMVCISRQTDEVGPS
jgi:hypothetical protein